MRRIESFFALLALCQISKTDFVKMRGKICCILVKGKGFVVIVIDFSKVVGISGSGVLSSHSVIIFKLKMTSVIIQYG